MERALRPVRLNCGGEWTVKTLAHRVCSASPPFWTTTQIPKAKVERALRRTLELRMCMDCKNSCPQSFLRVSPVLDYYSNAKAKVERALRRTLEYGRMVGRPRSKTHVGQ